MESVWKKQEDGSFVLVLQKGIAARYVRSGNRPKFYVDGQWFTLQNRGLFGSGMLVRDSLGKEVLALTPGGLFSRHYTLLSGGQAYKLTISNRPLATWCIQRNNEVILSYRLDASAGKLKMDIVRSDGGSVLFECLLFHLALPAFQENSSDDEMTLLLIAAVS